MSKSEDVNKAFDQLEQVVSDVLDAGLVTLAEQVENFRELALDFLKEGRTTFLAKVTESEKGEAVVDFAAAENYVRDFLRRDKKPDTQKNPSAEKNLDEMRDAVKRHYQETGASVWAGLAVDSWSDEEVGAKYDYLVREGFIR